MEFANLSKTHTLRGTLKLCEYSMAKVIILCHGLNCDRNSSFLPYLADSLSSSGYSSLRFDFSGSGTSDGEWSYANYSGEASDLEAATVYLRQRGLVPAAVLGHSKAATVILIHASTYHSIDKYIHISGRFNMVVSPVGRFSDADLTHLQEHGWFTWQGRRVTAEAFAERNHIHCDKIALSIPKPGPSFLLVHCEDDIIIPAQDSRELQASRPDLFPSLKIFSKGGHSFSSSTSRKNLLREILSFI